MPDLRARRTLKGVGSGVALALVGAGAYIALAPGSSQASTADLVTATAARATVSQTLTLSGSVQRTGQDSVSFPASGRVTAVKVAVSEPVTTGQVLATMDTTGLQQSVTVAEANLVAAQAALEASTTAVTTSSTSAAATTTVPSTSASSGTTRAAARTGSAARGPVLSTAAAHRSTTTVATLLSAAQTACAPLGVTATDGGGARSRPTSTTTPTPVSTSSTTSTSSPTSTTGTMTTTGTSTTATTSSMTTAPMPTPTVSTTSIPTPPATGPAAQQLHACIAALSSVMTAAKRSAQVMDRLISAIDMAATALQSQSAVQGQSSASGPMTARTSGARASASNGSGATGAGGLGSTAGAEVTVLRDEQALAGAQQALAGATLTSPIDGTIGEVGLTVGQVASTSSSIVVVGQGTALVTVSVPLTRLGLLRVGQPASVVPAGTTQSFAGVIQSIGILPSSTTSTTPSYPVVIAVSSAPQMLAAGSQAFATITLATVADAVTVPVSALAGVTNGTGEVTVMANGAQTPTRVSVGAVGQGLVQVTSGVTAGQVVLIANPAEPLPTATLGGFRGFSGRVRSSSGAG